MQWDFIGVRYDGKSFYVGNQSSGAYGIFFKPDGTKMYVVDRPTVKVYQYSLSTPWDISSASYDNISLDVSGQASNIRFIFLKPDGTKMWCTSVDTDKIYQYSLSTPWDISTASYDNISFDVGSQDSWPLGIFFKPDGTKMYVVGGVNVKVYQYSLSTPWDISSASYDNISFDVSGQDTDPQNTFFKPDGSKMWMAGGNLDKVYQYSLSTPWDISSASYDNISLDVSNLDTQLHAVFFKSDGSKMYVVGSEYDKVYQHSLFIPTPTAYAYIGG